MARTSRSYQAWCFVRRLLGLPVYPPGISVGERVWIGRGVELDWSHGLLIAIGDDVTIAQGARLLCHDASSHHRLGVTWVAPITVGDGVFIGVNALIMPGVTLGTGSVVAAGAVVVDDVEPGTVVAGVPARPLGSVADLDARRVERLRELGCFDEARYSGSSVDSARQFELAAFATEHGGLFLGNEKASGTYPRVGERA